MFVLQISQRQHVFDKNNSTLVSAKQKEDSVAQNYGWEFYNLRFMGHSVGKIAQYVSFYRSLAGSGSYRFGSYQWNQGELKAPSSNEFSLITWLESLSWCTNPRCTKLLNLFMWIVCMQARMLQWCVLFGVKNWTDVTTASELGPLFRHLTKGWTRKLDFWFEKNPKSMPWGSERVHLQIVCPVLFDEIPYSLTDIDCIEWWRCVTNIARISVQYVFRMNECTAQVLSSHIEHWWVK